jgi:hypothetical protein
MMDVPFKRGALPGVLLAMSLGVGVWASGAYAQTPADQTKKAEQIDPKNPAAPTATMESPELPKPQGAADRSKKDLGTPQPPEQPYPAKAKEK